MEGIFEFADSIKTKSRDELLDMLVAGETWIVEHRDSLVKTEVQLKAERLMEKIKCLKSFIRASYLKDLDGYRTPALLKRLEAIKEKGEASSTSPMKEVYSDMVLGEAIEMKVASREGKKLNLPEDYGVQFYLLGDLIF